MSHDDDAGRCNCRVCREGRELSRLVRVELSARRYLAALEAVNHQAHVAPAAEAHVAACNAYEEALHGFRRSLGEEGE